MVCGGSCDLLLLNLNPTRPGRSHRTEGAASGDSTSSRLLWAERTAVALPIYLTPLPQPQPGPPLRPHSPVAHPQSSTGTRRSPRAAAHSQADCRTADDLAGPVYGLVSIKMAKRKKERKKIRVLCTFKKKNMLSKRHNKCRRPNHLLCTIV